MERISTEEDSGTPGELTESYDKLLDERPEYYVFNGSVHGLKAEAPMKAKVGETVRIFFGVGGPNKTSAFHVIGEIFDGVHPLGSITGSSDAGFAPVANTWKLCSPAGTGRYDEEPLYATAVSTLAPSA